MNFKINHFQCFANVAHIRIYFDSLFLKRKSQFSLFNTLHIHMSNASRDLMLLRLENLMTFSSGFFLGEKLYHAKIHFLQTKEYVRNAMIGKIINIYFNVLYSIQIF